MLATQFGPHHLLLTQLPSCPQLFITLPIIICYFAPGMGAMYCDERVCLFLFACLSVRSHISKTTRQNHQISCTCCGRGSVLWRRCAKLCTSGLSMTSCFHIVGPIRRVTCIPVGERIEQQSKLLRRFQPNFAQRQRPATTRHGLRTEAESAVYDYLVMLGFCVPNVINIHQHL